MSTTPSEQDGENGRELISRREFARRKNWAPSYVVKLCQQGVLTVFIDCPACGSTCNSRAAHCTCGEAIADTVDASRGKVDAALAELELTRHKHPEKAHVTARHAEARSEPLPAAPPADGQLPLEDENVVSYAASKAKREEFQAKLAELDYLKRIGSLVERDAVERENFKIYRQVRDSLFTIPVNAAAELAAERDEGRCREKLTVLITRVCNELCRQIGGNPGASDATG